jgi:hypothetical protein
MYEKLKKEGIPSQEEIGGKLRILCAVNVRLML